MRSILVVAILLGPVVLGAQAPRDSVITISANRSIRVAPDRAVLFVTVEATAETAEGALSVSEARVAAVLAALRGIGPGIEVGAPATFSVAPTSSARGYAGPTARATVTARTAIRVDVLQLGLLPRILAAAGDAGATGGSTIAYGVSAADSVRRVARRDALAAARADADELARGLGGRIGGLVEVTSSSDERMFQQPAMLFFEAPYAQQTAAPEVVLQVSLVLRAYLVP